MGWLEVPPRSPPGWLVASGSALFVIYLFSAVGWLMLVETEFNGGFDDSLRWAWAPWLLVTIAFVLRYGDWLLECQRRRGRRKSRGRVWAMAAATWAMLTFMTWPHLVGLNALLGGPYADTRGPIVDKWISSGRSDTNVIEFDDVRSGRQVSIEVGDTLYAAARIGAQVHCRYRVGPLGFSYRWRSDDGPPACRLSGD